MTTATSPSPRRLSRPIRQRSQVQVLVRAMDVLARLADADTDLPLAQIGRDLGIHKSTCHRILATLRTGGFVEQAPDGRYRLGIRIFQIGNSMRRSLDLRARSMPALLALAEETGETIYLCIRHDRVAVCVERIEGRYASSLLLQLGGSLPLHVGGAPRALLAGMSDAEIDTYLSEELEQLTPKTLTDRAAILADIQHIRDQGGAIGLDNAMIGVKSFGAPIRNEDGVVVAALSVSGFTLTIPDTRESHLFDEARRSAARASAALGYVGH